MNLRNLAKLADVSVSTVSKAFSGSNDISEETRNRIFDIAKQNGCYDKYNKNKFDKKVIAVICPEVCSDYYNNYLTILKQKIEDNNGVMTVGIYDFSAEKKQELFSYYSCYCNVDGIIVLGNADFTNVINIPAINIGAPADNYDVINVNVDFSVAFDEAIKYLKNCGHTKIGYAGELLTLGKLNEFKASLRKNGLPVVDDYIISSNYRFERAGEEYFDIVLSQKERPTAVVAAYDNIAVGIIKTAKTHGLHIPKDLSIIGSDDMKISSYTDPPLSTISDSTDEVCECAVKMLLRKIDDPLCRCSSIQIKSKFIERESVSNLL